MEYRSLERSREDSEKSPSRQHHEGERQRSDEASSSKKARIDFATRPFLLHEQQQSERRERDLIEAHGPQGVAPITSSIDHSSATQRQIYPLDNFRQQDQIEQRYASIVYHHEPYEGAIISIKEEDKQHLTYLLKNLINQRLSKDNFIRMLNQTGINNKEVLLFYHDHILRMLDNRDLDKKDKYNRILCYTHEILRDDHYINFYYTS